MSSPPPLPRTVGPYRISGIVGQGPAATVYRAIDARRERIVAVKHFHRPGAAGVVEAVERLREHAALVTRLAHPAIVGVHEVDADDGRPFVAMELAAGVDLGRWLDAAPLPPPARVVEVMDRVLAALEAAHRAGTRHGDLVAANVLVTPAGAVRVTDFGTARATGRAGRAPEYLSERPIDDRVDLHAAGALLYRMLVGRDPFHGAADPDMLAATVRPPSKAAGCPPAFDAIVARALAHEPGQRFASAEEFRAALREAGRERPAVGGTTLSLGLPPGESRPASAPVAARVVAPVTPPSASARVGSPDVAPPVLTIAIPDRVLNMPSFDPWSAAETRAVARGAGEAHLPATAPAADRIVVTALRAPTPAGADATVASATAAASAALGAAASGRARPLAGLLTSLDLPAAPAAPAALTVSAAVAAAPARAADGLDHEHPAAAPIRIAGSLFPRPAHRHLDGDLQLPHPVEEGGDIPAEALRRVMRVLSMHFGELAGDVLKQVAGRAGTVDELHARLLEQAGSGIDKKRMAKQLKAVARLPL